MTYICSHSTFLVANGYNGEWQGEPCIQSGKCYKILNAFFFSSHAYKVEYQGWMSLSAWLKSKQGRP